jgi:surface polysaccharide O-acyltransferase-like enzyme
MSVTKISGFEYLRVLASLAVVVIHARFTNEILNGIYLTQFAVPCFILISIFLLGFNADKSSKEIFSKVFKRIFIQYSVWTILYLCLRYVKSILLNSEFTLGFNEIFLGGSSVQLWFLPAIFVWQIMMSYFYKIKNLIIDCILCLIFFMIGYFYNYYNTDHSAFLNLFLYYSGYVILGKIIFNNINVFTKIPSKIYLVLISILSICIIIKGIYKFTDLDFYIIDILYSTSIFIFFTVTIFRVNKTVSNLSKYSFGIYLSHFIFYQALYTALAFARIEITMFITICNIIVTFLISYLFCYLLSKSNLLSKII